MFNYKLTNIAIFLLAAFLLLSPLFFTNQSIFAGQNGCQTGPPARPTCETDNCDSRCNPNPNLPACPMRTNREQQKFAAMQIRNERSQPSRGGLNDGESPTRSKFTFFSSIFVLFGGIWLLLALLKQTFYTQLQAVRASLPKITRFIFRPAFSLSIGGILLAVAIAGNMLTAPTTAIVQESNQLSVKNNISPAIQSDTNFTIKNMFNYKSTNIAIFLLAAFFLIAPLFLTTQSVFAGPAGVNGGVPLEPRGNGNPPPNCPTPAAKSQQKFTAAQIRNERNQSPRSGLTAGESSLRSFISYYSSVFVLFGGIWLLIVLLKQTFGTRLRAVRARLPKIARFVFRPAFSLSIGGILLAAATAGNMLTAPPTTATVQENSQLSVNGNNNPSFQSNTEFTINNMFNYKSTNIAILFFAAFFLIAPLFLANQTVFAGQSGAQGGDPTDPCLRPDTPGCPTPTPMQQQKLAAAQLRNERNQSPHGGLNAGETPTHSNFTFFASIFVLFGGLWTLFALLRNQFGKRRQPNKARLTKVWDLAFKPSFALSAFAFLFLAAIVGGVLTKPTTVAAGKRDKPDKKLMTGLINPSNKPVFKMAQEIGGSGTTQVGAPVFDAAGNRYVNGGFTGTLTVGAATLTATKDFDMFIAKYDANGNALWARQAGGSTSGAIPASLAVEGATALSVDANGNVYLGGSFVKTLTLQGGANANVTLNDNGAPGINYESFVAKYDANGNLLWAKGGNTNSPKNPDNLETGQNGINRIVFDAGGNPYIGGFVSGNQFLGSAFTNQGQSDILLAKLNPANGAIVWKQIIGGSDDDNGLDLKIDGANNLYLIGNFGSPEITFPHGETFSNPADPNSFEGNSTDTFIAKFDTTGANLWTEDINNAAAVGTSQIAVSAAGEIFMTGYFFDSVTFGATTLTENEGGATEDEASFGGYVTKMDVNGDFVWAKQFGGIGDGLALDGAGRVYVVGTFYDGGAFGDGTPNAENLASFGGEDLFIARYDANGDFAFAKPIAGAGSEGEIVIGNPSAENGGKTENSYNPLGISYNPATGTMFVSSDFQKVIALDCLTLTTTGTARHSYIAELTADGEPTNCRIWNGLDADDNNFDSPDNWNGGVIPGNNDSIYVPYTGNSFDNPNYNPAGIGIIVNNLTVSDDRTLTVERDLPITGKLWLLGGLVDAGANRLLDLTNTATANRIADADGNGGYVLGKLRKDFGSSLAPFVFPVGTASGYSPVDVSPQFGFGALLSVKAIEQPQPLFANTANRINRYWNIERAGKGFIEANLTFHYLQPDVVGNESLLKLFKVEENTPLEQTATIDTTANTATVNNVSEFSDWTLAQPLAPTAASAVIGGRVIDGNGRGIARARVTITGNTGNARTTSTNSFGYYHFDNVMTGANYVFNVSHKQYKFSQATQVQFISGDENINFIAAF